MQKLDELMRERGVSIHDLEVFLNVSYDAAWRRAKGKTKLSNLEEKNIAEWLGVSEGELKGE